MAISINSAADARYYAARANSSRTNSSSAAKKSTSSIVSSAARAVAAATSAVKSVVKKNSSSATTTTKRNNTNAAVNAASASVKSKTNQNKKTTTTVSSAASKVASSISKAVKTATNAVKTAAQNTKASTNAKAAAASTTKTASKNTTNAKAAAVNTSNTRKTTSSNNNNLASRIVNTVSTAASTVKKATSNVNTSAAAERARQEAMSKAASARAEAEAKARVAAATKSATKTTTTSVTADIAISNTTRTSTKNNYSGYGPFKPALFSELSCDADNKIKSETKSQITYTVPYTENKTNIIKDNFTILKPDNNGKFGYVLYNGEQYPITYNEIEEGKQYLFQTWEETHHFQFPESGPGFDLVAAIANTSPEEMPRRTLTTTNGQILLQKDTKSNELKHNRDTLDISNQRKGYVVSHSINNVLSFVQNGLIRNNYDVTLMRDGANNLASTITYTQNYLGENKNGMPAMQSTSTQLLAINNEGNIYNINDQKE